MSSDILANIYKLGSETETARDGGARAFSSKLVNLNLPDAREVWEAKFIAIGFNKMLFKTKKST